MAQHEGPLTVFMEIGGERTRWQFDTASVIDYGPDDLGNCNSLAIPLQAAEMCGDKRYAIDRNGIVWISHYASGTPAIDGEILVRPGQRDAMLALQDMDPEAYERCFVSQK